MESTRINIKISKRQHDMLKQLSEHTGLNMTSWIQHQILNQFDLMTKSQVLPSQLKQLQDVLSDVKKINPEQLSIFHHLGDKV
jgi:uncharacterized protein (DUF1778 family)